MRLLSILPILLLCASCTAGDDNRSADIEALRKEIAALKAASPAPASAPAAASPPPVELGQQMLELQVRHARLWQAIQARNWMLAQFQLAELRETLGAVVELNGEHAALQPRRLAEVLPAVMNPSLERMQHAVDEQDAALLESAYDEVSKACTSCHADADHAFLVIQRPKTPMLDNLRAAATP